MSAGIFETHFQFANQSAFYKGKVRDVYTINNDLLIIVASDRISAFDFVLPRPIPYKGQVLNQIAYSFLEETKNIVPNWLIESPHPYVSIGKKCTPIKIEMVVRGYLAGHSWREYQAGRRLICGVNMPEGMKEGDKFPNPIITPATKADEGHDEDISREAILSKGIVETTIYHLMEEYALKLFEFGTAKAIQQGLILVDTKYEFGIDNEGNLLLIDEIHTPDSSRYYIDDGYEEKQLKGERQLQLSKEFVREWLMDNNFMGKEGQQVPIMPNEFVELVTNRYIELYEKLIGKKFLKVSTDHIINDIDKAISGFMNR